MATLTAWAFPGVDDAEQASQKLQALQAQELIKIEDAAVVSWEPGKKKPKTRQLSNMTAAGALGGTFLFLTLRLRRRPSRRGAALLFHYSLLYLALLFVAAALDPVLF